MAGNLHLPKAAGNLHLHQVAGNLHLPKVAKQRKGLLTSGGPARVSQAVAPFAKTRRARDPESLAQGSGLPPSLPKLAVAAERPARTKRLASTRKPRPIYTTEEVFDSSPAIPKYDLKDIGCSRISLAVSLAVYGFIRAIGWVIGQGKSICASTAGA
jgi:hypothetical protein